MKKARGKYPTGFFNLVSVVWVGRQKGEENDAKQTLSWAEGEV